MIEYGWVNVGHGDLRPAYSRDCGPVAYSPAGAGAWRDAPEEIAATWIPWYADDAWVPFTAPEGMRVVA